MLKGSEKIEHLPRPLNDAFILCGFPANFVRQSCPAVLVPIQQLKSKHFWLWRKAFTANDLCQLHIATAQKRSAKNRIHWLWVSDSKHHTSAAVQHVIRLPPFGSCQKVEDAFTAIGYNQIWGEVAVIQRHHRNLAWKSAQNVCHFLRVTSFLCQELKRQIYYDRENQCSTTDGD